MSIKSVYLPEPFFDNGQIRITGEEHHHLLVARAEKDEPLEVFDGKGNVWTVTVVRIARQETTARLKTARQVHPPRADLIMALALVRLQAFEWALEKTVEVGVTRIIPVIAARSSARPPGRYDRWRRILIESAKQSKRYHLPQLDSPTRFQAVLQVEAQSKILFAERGGGPLHPAVSRAPVLFLIGPEGGWTESELAMARRSGFQEVYLGPYVLRSETAAVVGAALVQYEMGLL